MKNVKAIIIGVLCAALILGYYVYLSTRDNSSDSVKEQNAVEKMISMSLEGDKYPKAPRKVVEVFNEILCCYYNEEYTDQEFKELVEQQRKLLDEELLENNPEQQFLITTRADADKYKENKKTITSYTICSTDDVIYKTIDDRECAYVTCSYFVKNGDKGFENTYQCYVLRKDDDGQWKILVYYLIEGDEDVE